jgi:hypothetical protein
MTMAISPHFTNQHFAEPLSLEDKVAIFADRVRGWQLDIAQFLDLHPHSGFAVLAIVSNYFEMIAKYQDGNTSRHLSEAYFGRGLRSVLEPLDSESSSLPDELVHTLYDEVRCGMYHAGMTGPRVVISRNPEIGVLRGTPGRVEINPYRLVDILQMHFSSYVASLLDPANAERRHNFEKRFDAGHTGKRMGR